MDDAFEDFWRTRMVPNAFWIDHGDGALDADAQAVRLGAEDGGVATGVEAEFFEAAFEEIPGYEAGFFGTTIRHGLIGAEEDVALDFSDPMGFSGAAEFVVHGMDVTSWTICGSRTSAHVIP